MAASGERRQRRGPAPIASFDHDVSDESSPETKQTFRLPEIREDPACSSSNVAEEASSSGNALAPPEQRARSHSSPAVHATAALNAPAAPRIDISRASSSSHHDSRDSSPELALFAGTGSGEEARAKLELGFREDGALDLRSSTEELAFLEGAPGNGNGDIRAPTTAPPSRRHSRKDSQGSETALLAVSGRTSRLSSVGSQCSAHSALSGFSHASRVSRLSVVSGVSRSPSPHKMLLETSFCGPKPIETDPEICAAAVEERLLEIAKLSTEAAALPAPPVDARDRREVRTEVTVESSSARSTSSTARIVSPVPPPTTPTPTPTPSAALTSTVSSGAIPKQTPQTQPPIVPADEEKRLKETRNRARVEERKARSKDRREPSQPEVYKSSNRSKDIIRIKLKPDDEYDDDDDESERTLISGEPARKPVTLELNDNCVQTLRANEISVSPLTTRRSTRDSRTPSPSGVPVSRKSSFCSLFKSRETIASPDSPSDALKRKKSLNEGRSRSKSRDRSVTPTSAGKIKGSVLSLFKTPRKSATSPSPSSRDGSPIVQTQRQFPQTPVDRHRTERLKYYEESKDGIIHIPLRTPPDELDTASDKVETLSRDVPRPSSAPQVRSMPERPVSAASAPLPKLTQRTVLPDGSIIIPLHSPTEKTPNISTTPEIETLPPTTVTQTPIVTPKEDKRSLEVNNTPENITEPTNNYAPEESSAPDTSRAKRKERIIFTTHVGSREQVFSTQFSITKTPSVTSEMSESTPSFPDSEEMRPIVRETENTMATVEIGINGIKETSPKAIEQKIEKVSSIESAIEAEGSAPGTPQDTGRDSSESDAGSEALTRGGSDVERRGLVIQESFEELPYVPTTLPQERSLGVPIVPVRERGGVRVAGVQRPRATHNAVSTLGRVAAPSSAMRDAPAERLRIQLPRRPRAASASAAPPPPERARTRSGSEVSETRKTEWIDFSEVPERRKQPKRIQTLPARARSPALSYAPPEHCRCECHAHPPAAPPDDELPLLDDAQQMTISSSSLECGEGVQVNVHIAPFTADLDLHNHDNMGRPQ
ncbi:mucin-5AC [Zerene cesonia]|uniref:mucin-5AC n=1 Tax=Zerene cesonia TaxID=33412 RepID=UPI0018E5A58A|nr:mucin-5AC [Zerene cesonia]XP_038212922.1 mucin-5AC [Zerene cesonia]